VEHHQQSVITAWLPVTEIDVWITGSGLFCFPAGNIYCCSGSARPGEQTELGRQRGDAAGGGQFLGVWYGVNDLLPYCAPEVFIAQVTANT